MVFLIIVVYVYVCVGQGLITWAKGQQPNLVKALRQENSGGHRDWSGQMLSSSSPMYVLIILKDCRDRVGGKGNNLTAGTPYRHHSLTQYLNMKATDVCYSYFRESGLISRSSLHPGDGHRSVHTAGRGCVADRPPRTAMRVIPTALSLRGQQ